MPIPTPPRQEIKIWTDKTTVKINESLTIYAKAKQVEDVNVYVYQDNRLRAIYTIYLKRLGVNKTTMTPSRLCTNCTLVLEGIGRETKTKSNRVTVRVEGKITPAPVSRFTPVPRPVPM
jgi:hypothetical protein